MQSKYQSRLESDYETRKTKRKKACYRFVIGFVSLTRHGFWRCADKSAQFSSSRERAFVTIRWRGANTANLNPAETLKLTKRNAAAKEQALPLLSGNGLNRRSLPAFPVASYRVVTNARTVQRNRIHNPIAAPSTGQVRRTVSVARSLCPGRVQGMLC